MWGENSCHDLIPNPLLQCLRTTSAMLAGANYYFVASSCKCFRKNSCYDLIPIPRSSVIDKPDLRVLTGKSLTSVFWLETSPILSAALSATTTLNPRFRPSGWFLSHVRIFATISSLDAADIYFSFRFILSFNQWFLFQSFVCQFFF